MNKITLETSIACSCVCEDISYYVDIFSSIFTVILGVLTIILGTRYLTIKRNEAKVGFYINLQIYIKRLNFYISKSEYKGLTDYLCEKKLREKHFGALMPIDRATRLIPIFVELSNSYLDFISHADNNIVPKYKKNKQYNKKEEWNKWHESILITVDFLQTCKFLDEGITPYVSEKHMQDYKDSLRQFKEALGYLDTKLESTLKK